MPEKYVVEVMNVSLSASRRSGGVGCKFTVGRMSFGLKAVAGAVSSDFEVFTEENHAS